MGTRFAKLSEVNPDAIASWENPLFLTLDIDWACDEVLANAIDLLEKADVAATWFVTHDTPLLERLRANPKFELGIHPNFNFLLNNDSRNGGTAKEVVNRLMSVVPEAKSVRSHSITQSTNILQIFVETGLTHDANHFIPEQAGMVLKPWRLWNGLIKVPYFWEDDVACIYPPNAPIRDLTKRAGMKVFNFHPIHIFLNTESLDRYERTREIHRNPEVLEKHRYFGDGARSALETLLGLD